MTAISTTPVQITSEQVITNTGANPIVYDLTSRVSASVSRGQIKPGASFDPHETIWIVAPFGDSTYALSAAPLNVDGSQLVLMAHFKDPSGSGQNSTADDDQRLYIAASPDGLNFSQLAGPLSPPGQAYRDLGLLEFNGAWYMVGTNWTGTILLHTSPSLLPGTFTDLPSIDATQALPGAISAWAGEFFQDDDGTIYLIASVGTAANDTTFASPMRPYVWKANDATLTSWTALGPQQRLGTRSGAPLTGNATGAWDLESAIDYTYAKIGSTYHMICKESRSQFLQHWTASNFMGPWTLQIESWQPGWTWPQYLEAPQLVRQADGHWYLYADKLFEGRIYAGRSNNVDDLNSWGAPYPIRVPGTARHPWIKRTTARRHRDLALDLALTGGGLNQEAYKFYAYMWLDTLNAQTGSGNKLIPFNKSFDPEKACDLTNHRIVIPRAGFYTIDTQVMFDAQGSTWWILTLFRGDLNNNPATFNAIPGVAGGGPLVKSINGSGDQLCLDMSRTIWCDAGDLISAYAAGSAPPTNWNLRGDTSWSSGKTFISVRSA